MSLPVTLQQVKDHLRVDTDAEDSDISGKLLAAQAAVLNYLKVDSLDALAVGSPAAIPGNVDAVVTASTLLLVGYLYRLRDDNDNSNFRASFEFGNLPVPVTALLYPLRDPACA